MKELSFIDLVSAMREGRQVMIHGRDAFLKGQKTLINGIAREDGSGRKWIVTVIVGSGPVGIFWDESRPCPFVTVD